MLFLSSGGRLSRGHGGDGLVDEAFLVLILGFLVVRGMVDWRRRCEWIAGVLLLMLLYEEMEV